MMSKYMSTACQPHGILINDMDHRVGLFFVSMDHV